MTEQELLKQCDLQNWYPLFKNHTFKTDFISLPQEVVEYLKSDCMTILGAQSMTSQLSDSDSDQDEVEESQVSFPALESQIQSVLNHHSCFVKLNNTAPQDSSFLNCNTLECFTIYDIFLLLKTSDFVHFMLLKQNQVVLQLREYFSLNRMYEYRCFVKDFDLVCVSQRDMFQVYDYIDSEWEGILQKIQKYIQGIVIPRLQKLDLKDVAVDLYVLQKRIMVIDLNPMLEMTDCYLYSYKEWTQGITTVPLLRYLRKGEELKTDRFTHNKVPKEMIDFSNGKTTFEFIDTLSTELAQSALQDSK